MPAYKSMIWGEEFIKILASTAHMGFRGGSLHFS